MLGRPSAPLPKSNSIFLPGLEVPICQDKHFHPTFSVEVENGKISQERQHINLPYSHWCKNEWYQIFPRKQIFKGDGEFQELLLSQVSHFPILPKIKNNDYLYLYPHTCQTWTGSLWKLQRWGKSLVPYQDPSCCYDLGYAAQILGLNPVLLWNKMLVGVSDCDAQAISLSSKLSVHCALCVDFSSYLWPPGCLVFTPGNYSPSCTYFRLLVPNELWAQWGHLHVSPSLHLHFVSGIQWKLGSSAMYKIIIGPPQSREVDTNLNVSCLT